jgi:hypothetical protein
VVQFHSKKELPLLLSQNRHLALGDRVWAWNLPVATGLNDSGEKPQIPPLRWASAGMTG